MSGGFSFPPPPPPPPKSTSNEHDLNSDTGFRGRGRGRGRGGPRGRYSQNDRSALGTRGNLSSNGYHSNSSRHAQSQSYLPSSYVNPNFSSTGSRGQANGHKSRGNHQQQNSAASPPRTAAGQKRKLEALREPNHGKEKRPGPQAAPAVPSFGAPIVAIKPVEERPVADGEKKSSAKSLGLTPAADDIRHTYSDSEDERDVDEEAMYAELGDKLTFEHNGVVMSLKSQADLAAWKRERQKKWPTKARMAERGVERRRIGEERKRLLGRSGALARGIKSNTGRESNLDQRPTKVVTALSEGPVSSERPQDRREGVSNLEKTKQEVADQQKKLEELRKKVAESEARNREAKAERLLRQGSISSGEAQGEMPDAREEANHLIAEDDALLQAESDDVNDPTDEVDSNSTSTTSSDSTSDADSDDDAPEEITSKAPATAFSAPDKPHCKQFSATGSCRYGIACRFKHEQLPEAKPLQRQQQQEQQTQKQGNRSFQHLAGQEKLGRKSIFQRLVEQEQGEEDRLALQAIKYLGKIGFFTAPAAEGG